MQSSHCHFLTSSWVFSSSHHLLVGLYPLLSSTSLCAPKGILPIVIPTHMSVTLISTIQPTPLVRPILIANWCKHLAASTLKGKVLLSHHAPLLKNIFPLQLLRDPLNLFPQILFLGSSPPQVLFGHVCESTLNKGNDSALENFRHWYINRSYWCWGQKKFITSSLITPSLT